MPDATALHTLADAQPPQEGAQVAVPFPALYQGQRGTVTAVLERTAIFLADGAPGDEKVVARKDAVAPLAELVWIAPNPASQREAARRGRLAGARGRRVRFGSHRDTDPFVRQPE